MKKKKPTKKDWDVLMTRIHEVADVEKAVYLIGMVGSLARVVNSDDWERAMKDAERVRQETREEVEKFLAEKTKTHPYLTRLRMRRLGMLKRETT
jgi:hypothetical protein